MYTFPEIAPNKHTFPAIIFSSALKSAFSGFLTDIVAPDKPFPK